MKKGVLAVFILFIVLSSMVVYAVDNSSNSTANSTTVTKDQELKDLKALPGQLAEDAAKALQNEVVLPEFLQAPARYILGLKPEDHVTLEQFVVLIACWIALFIILHNFFPMIFMLLPFAQSKGTQWILTIGFTIAIAVTGFLKIPYTFFISLGGLFGVFEKTSITLKAVEFILAVALVIVVMMIFSNGFKWMEAKLEEQKAKEKGREIAESMKLINKTGKSIEKATKE